jgi:hypothetical protein
MILICGIRSEPPVALAIEAAEEAGIEHVVFHQREVHQSGLEIGARDGLPRGTMWIQGKEWDLCQFSGLYARLLEHDMIPECKSNEDGGDPLAAVKSHFFQELLLEWLEIAPGRVVNKTSAMTSNASKPYQTQQISEAGFRTPPTLITNDPAEALAFAREHGRIIYKSISSVRSIVREWSASREKDLERLRHLPVQFQARIPGHDVRVHVVGDEVFATHVASEAVDYRYAQRDGLDADLSPCELPRDVKNRCVELSRRLDLPFCGIDLRREPSGEMYCFEVNPSPAYSYYQESTGQPIARALVRYLDGSA